MICWSLGILINWRSINLLINQRSTDHRLPWSIDDQLFINQSMICWSWVSWSIEDQSNYSLNNQRSTDPRLPWSIKDQLFINQSMICWSLSIMINSRSINLLINQWSSDPWESLWIQDQLIN